MAGVAWWCRAGWRLTKRWLDWALAIGDHLRAIDDAVRMAQNLDRDSPERVQAEAFLGALMVDTPLAPRGHPRGRGRPPIDKALVLRVAVEYDRALQRKDRRRVNHIVAARLKLTPARVRALVHQARKERFLTKTHQGVPGGQLTPVALARLPRQPKGTRRKLGGRRRRR